MNIETIKMALDNAKRNERHRNVAETRYWLEQYKIIATDAIKAIAALQEAIAEAERQSAFTNGEAGTEKCPPGGGGGYPVTGSRLIVEGNK